MLTIEAVPILFTIISKLDIKPIITVLKGIDIFDSAENTTDAMAQLSGEKIATLGAEIFAAVAPQLGKIANDIPEFVAVYKNVSLDEAKKLDLADVFNEIINDDGIRSFFTRALRRKVEQTV